MNWITSCRGKRSLLIIAVSLDAKANRGTTTSQCLLCVKTGDTIAIPHVKRKYFPIVYFEFTKRLVDTQRYFTVISLRKSPVHCFERYLLVKGVNHVNVPRGEHHSIGVAEKAIQDLSNMMRCMLADSNVPNIYWDFVIEHAALVNSMITPSISDKQKQFSKLFGMQFQTLI
jgi:hypothetical protein